MSYQDVLKFWFEESQPEDWFTKNPDYDERISQRFSSLHQQAAAGELWQWRETIQGRLAEIILLDQFSRNMFRGDPRSFAYDSMALVLAQEALKDPALEQLPVQQKAFLYMPFMHSESLKIHDIAMALFSEEGLEHNLEFEIKHREIIERFGRYPHRNELLGRPSTSEELTFLTEPGSSF
ncbi:DUF924 family protein [Vagococcus elongatus]|uniref:DUF924 domain-containing protein n=1 Tax=Vagococcus elongatus TaxID=180344 RepID=A0A430B4F6_9ENTE|nr:DUF924 family protein [Vagococcus elongatus]RSU15204.1 hypothetical protein CBF29_02395 [Vagococcus elongatus]